MYNIAGKAIYHGFKLCNFFDICHPVGTHILYDTEEVPVGMASYCKLYILSVQCRLGIGFYRDNNCDDLVRRSHA